MVKKLSNFTIVIRVKNEERWIGHCIQSILDNIKNPEIILVLLGNAPIITPNWIKKSINIKFLLILTGILTGLGCTFCLYVPIYFENRFKI